MEKMQRKNEILMYALLRAILFNCLTVSSTHTHTHIYNLAVYVVIQCFLSQSLLSPQSFQELFSICCHTGGSLSLFLFCSQVLGSRSQGGILKRKTCVRIQGQRLGMAVA